MDGKVYCETFRKLENNPKLQLKYFYRLLYKNIFKGKLSLKTCLDIIQTSIPIHERIYFLSVLESKKFNGDFYYNNSCIVFCHKYNDFVLVGFNLKNIRFTATDLLIFLADELITYKETKINIEIFNFLENYKNKNNFLDKFLKAIIKKLFGKHYLKALKIQDMQTKRFVVKSLLAS
jgi:hypothetical protein